MSTRSAIAKGTPESWEGVYHHSDGYPSGLGVELITLKDLQFNGNLDKMIKSIVDDEPVGWSSINGCDWSLAPNWHDEWPYPDNAPQSYSARGEEIHGEKNDHMTKDNVDTLFIEWVYILTPEGIYVGCPIKNYQTNRYSMGPEDEFILVPWNDSKEMVETYKHFYSDEEE